MKSRAFILQREISIDGKKSNIQIVFDNDEILTAEDILLASSDLDELENQLNPPAGEKQKEETAGENQTPATADEYNYAIPVIERHITDQQHLSAEEFKKFTGHVISYEKANPDNNQGYTKKIEDYNSSK